MRLTQICLGYFKRYVEREIAKSTGLIVKKPVQGWRIKRIKPAFHYTENRPWTEAAKQANHPMNKHPRIFLEPIKEWTIYLGDRVLSAALCRLLHSTNPVAMSDSPSSRATPIPEGILLGLGNPLLDIRVRADKSFLDKYNLKPDNSILAEDRHDVMFQEMVQKYKAEFLPGGATQNTIRVAQWLLQSPRATSFIGAVGDDEYGKILKRISQEVGVNVLYEVIEGAKSGLCGAVITDQRRSLVTKLGAAKLLDLDFVRRPEVWKHVEKARYYYVGGYVLPVCPEAIKNILHHASVNDKQVVMNLHATYLCGDFLRKDLNLMHYIDVLFGNGPEARKFAELAGFGTQDVREIALKVSGLPKANAKRGRVVVFTQGGSKSMFVAHNGEVTEYPIQPVDPALIKDTNACGDAFAGGFISQYIQGKSLDECMRCSIYAARVIVQNYGCSFPEKPEFK